MQFKSYTKLRRQRIKETSYVVVADPIEPIVAVDLDEAPTEPVTPAYPADFAGSSQIYDAPLASDSVWRKPLAKVSSARYHPAPGLANLHIGLANWANTAVPMFRATAGDRVIRILHCADTWYMVATGRWKQIHNTVEIETAILAQSSERFPFPYHSYVTQAADANGSSLVLPDLYDPRLDPAQLPLQILAPEKLHPVQGPDGHIVIFQPDGSAFEAFGAVVLSNGVIVCSTYKVTKPTLGGDGFQNGVRASMIPVYAGLIRKDEIASRSIAHAVPIVLPATLMHTSWAYPASAFDRGALRESPSYTGPFPMGARFAIDPKIDLGELGLGTDVGRAIAMALQTHGAILVDRGGGGCTLVTEEQASDINYSWGIQSDLIVLLKNLVYVTTSPDEFRGSSILPKEPFLSMEPVAATSGWVVPRDAKAGTVIAKLSTSEGATLAIVFDPGNKLTVDQGMLKLTHPFAGAESELNFAVRASAFGEGKVVTGTFTISG